MTFYFWNRRKPEVNAARTKATVTETDIAVIRALREDGLSYRGIATETGLSLATVAKYGSGAKADADDVPAELEKVTILVKQAEQVQKLMGRWAGRVQGGFGHEIVGFLAEELPAYRQPLTELALSYAALLRARAASMGATALPSVQTRVVETSEPEAQQPQRQEAPLTIIAQHVINELKDKSPQEGAQWLASQPYPQASSLVAEFRQTSDDQIPVLLTRLAQTSVDLAGIVAWLRQRPEWLMETVHAIRQSASVEVAT